MVAISASSYSITMGDTKREEVVVESAVELLGDGPFVRIAAEACRILARAGADHEEPDAQELRRLDRTLALVERALEGLLANIEPDAVELQRQQVDLAAVVAAAIVEVPDRERISYAHAERTAVVVDPHRARLACGLLLHAAVDDCAAGERVRVRTLRSGLVEIVRRGVVRMEAAAFAVKVAQRIARAHGGDASVESIAGTTRWNLWFPLPRARPRLRGRVLLIDDNVEQCRALGELLKLEGLTVDVSFSAEEALTYLAARRPDLLLVDMRLGEVGGDEVIRLARGHYPGLPAIVISGYPREHARVRAILSEAPSDYMAKPTDPDALFKLVARMISAKA